MYRFPLLVLITFIISFDGLAQDLIYAKKTINTLTAKKYWGRGYTKDGMSKAADFIEKEFKRLGLTALDGGKFKQEFTFAVNTFPGQMEVMLNGAKLKPGKDFIVHQSSKGYLGTDSLNKRDSVTYFSKNSLVLSIVPKLTWSVAQTEMDYTIVEVDKKAISAEPAVIKVAIENKLKNSFTAANVMAIVKGTAQPDSLLIFTAHYDHLGGMGDKTYFPGANDNASGVAMLLDLAKYYAAHPSKYSIVFMAFAAEEAGLLGSKYFTENPLVSLKNIRFLWNLDLLGNGDAGATVVNATIHPKEFALLNKINEEKKYLLKINPRGKAANSDHHFFTERGVPAFFLYTQGGSPAYHDVDDVAKTLPLTVYENLFKLFVDFNTAIVN